MIINFRLGHACNSSSTHSIMFLNPEWHKKPKEDLCGGEGEYFGQEDFVLTTEASKSKYFAAQLVGPMARSFGSVFAKIIIKDLTDLAIDIDDCGVDHQSQLSFPTEFNGKHLKYDFIKELNKFLKNENIVIYGGNDNDGGLYKLGQPLPLNKITECDNYIARKDPLGYWLLYNRWSGHKLRMTFDNKHVEAFTHYTETPPQYCHSTYPELVDLKITNACSKNCAFCYQGSTKDGKHACFEDISHLAYYISNYEIPEVALGGGEPTEHPDFINILRRFKDYGVVPNFTTATLDWVKNKEVLEAVKNNCGSFAYSVHSIADMRKFLKVLNKFEYCPYSKNGVRATVQVVLGIISMEALFKVASLCRHNKIQLTILGYKECNRGKEFVKKPYKDWLESVNLANCENFGIDTSVAKEFDLKHSSYLYNKTVTETEGAFSMYIDAVEHRFGASSYGETYPNPKNTADIFEKEYPKFFVETKEDGDKE